MNISRLSRLALFVLFFLSVKVVAQDPNLHIYLCFGQSNMEGQGTIEAQDKTVDNRFQVLQAVNCSNSGKTKGIWYNAIPPLTRCYSGLSPSDYFGRTMVANLPAEVRVGIINVSVAGCKIELFDKDNYQDYVETITEDWLKAIIANYDGNPYAYLVDMAKLAQKDGVIKGILLHQGESNTGDTQWPTKVKNIYNNLVEDLSLNADSVPLLAGEVVHADQGGICASMNTIIDRLPQTLPNSYVISSSGCTAASDNLHFNSAGYRELGWRYAETMLRLMEIRIGGPQYIESVFLEAECGSVGENWDIIADTEASNDFFVTAKSGFQSISAVDTSAAAAVVLPFIVDTARTFNLFAWLNCRNSGDDSFYFKMDDEPFSMKNSLATKGWEWKQIKTFDLAAGEHMLTVSYREDGAKLDKLLLTNDTEIPEGAGEEAINSCSPLVAISDFGYSKGYALGENYPNPFDGQTNISFRIPKQSVVSLKVFNVLGVEVANLATNSFSEGEHNITFSAENLTSGMYYYVMRSADFIQSRSMVVQNK